MSLERILKEEAELEKQYFSTEESETPPKEEEIFTPQETEIPEPTPEVIVTEVEDKEELTWKKRFTNFKASTDITIRDLRRENASLKGKLSDMYNEMEELSRKVNTLSVKEDPFKDILTEEEAFSIGEDTINVLKKATQKIAENSTAPLKEELDRLKRREQESLKKESENEIERLYVQEFQNPLARLVPDFDQINIDPRFIKYLEGVDPDTGIQRLSLLRKAESVRDAGRAASFFIDFKRLIGKSSLESRITPVAKGATSDPMQRSVPKVFTEADVKRHYSDHAKGVYRGREKEWKILEAQIDKAYLDGNIR